MAYGDVLYTDPTVANQAIQMAQLNSAREFLPQTITVAQIQADKARQAQLQEAQQRNYLQYSQLANQQQQQEAQNQLSRDLQAEQLKSAAALQASQIAGNKELALINPYGKGGVDAYLGDIQIRNKAQEDSAASQAEASRLTAALNNLRDSHRSELNLIQKQRLEDAPTMKSLYGTIPFTQSVGDWTLKHDKAVQDSKQKFMTDANTLISQAQHSTYNPTTQKFEPIARSPITMSAMLNRGTNAPVAAPVIPPATNAPSFTPQSQLQPYGPGLNGTEDALQLLDQAYMNRQITPEEYSLRYKSIKGL